MSRINAVSSEDEARLVSTSPIFGFNVRSGNQIAFDGNAMALQGLAQGIAQLDPGEQIRYYLDGEPEFDFFRTNAQRQARVLRPVRGVNRLLRRWDVEPWYQVRLQLELWQNSPTVYFQVGQEPLPRSIPCPSVLLIHDIAFRLPDADTYFEPPVRQRLEALTDSAIRRATRLAAVSHACKADIVAHYGYPADRIHVAQHGFDRDRFQPIDQEEARQQLHETYPQTENPYILFVGRIQPRKNMERLLQALQTAKKRGLAQRLLVTGKQGWSTDGVFAQVESLGLSDSVHFLGGVPMAEVPLLMNGADFLAIPSIAEGFGIPALEAMACGVPVLGGDSGGLPEVIGDAGLLVDPFNVEAIAEALLELGGDAAFRRRLGERALARSAQFSWERAANSVLDCMRRAAAA